MDKDSCQRCGGRGFTVHSKKYEEHGMVVYDEVVTDCGECGGSFYAHVSEVAREFDEVPGLKELRRGPGQDGRALRRVVCPPLFPSAPSVAIDPPRWPKVWIDEPGPSLQDIGVEKLELRDGHAYVNGEDMGEIKVVANDEADAESAELLTKFLHWQSRTK